MATVTGYFGDQPIELDNAATESTLKELVAAVNAMAKAKGGGGSGDAKKAADEVKKLATNAQTASKNFQQLSQAEKDAIKATKENTKAQEENTEAQEALLKATEAFAYSLQNVGKTAERLVLGMTDLMSTFANIGNSASAAASSLSAIPMVGGVLSGVFGAVAGAAEKMIGSYQDAAGSGVTFSGSLNEMQRSASAAGLTIDAFVGIVQNNTEGLMMFGGSAEEGAKRLASMGKEIRNSAIGDQLLRLGYSTEDVNGGMAKYVSMISRYGAQEGKTTRELALSAGEYMKELDGLARLTGQSREALQAEQEARLMDAQFNAMLQGKTEEEITMLQNFVSSFPQAQQAAVKEMLATGNITSDAGIKFQAMFGQSANEIMRMGQVIQQTGRVSEQSLNNAYDNSLREQKAFQQSDLFRTMSNYAMDEYGELMVSSTQMAARDLDAREKILEEQREAEREAAEARELEGFKQRLAETSNLFTEFLATSGLLDELEMAFAKLIDFTTTIIIPTFSWMADNISLLAWTVGPLLGLFATMKGLIIAYNAAQVAKTVATGVATGATSLFSGTLAAGLATLVAPLAAMATAVWAAVAPFLPVVAAIAALGAAAYGLWYIFKRFGGDLDVIKMSFSYAFKVIDGVLLQFKLGIFKLLEWLPGLGDWSNEIQSAQDEITQNEYEKAATSQAIADRMAQNVREREEAEARAAEEERRQEELRLEQERLQTEQLDGLNNQSAQQFLLNRRQQQAAEELAEQQEETAEVIEDSREQMFPTDVGQGNPLVDMQLYGMAGRGSDAAVGANRSAGVPAITSVPSAIAHGEIGAMSAQFESGSRGSEAVGFDSTGGTSYGKYQIATRTGTMDQFMSFLADYNPEAHAQLAAAGDPDSGRNGQFANVWRELAASGGLGDAEHEFIKRTHYDVGMAGVENPELQALIEGNRALQDVMWSTSVQHGGGGASGIFNEVYREGMSEEDLVRAIYAERGTRFGSSTPQVRQSVLNRFGNEEAMALAMLNDPQLNTPAPNVAAAGITPEETLASAPTTAEELLAQAGMPGGNPNNIMNQDQVVELLAQLNTQLATLVRYQDASNRLERRSIGSMAGAGDVFTSP